MVAVAHVCPTSWPVPGCRTINLPYLPYLMFSSCKTSQSQGSRSLLDSANVRYHQTSVAWPEIGCVAPDIKDDEGRRRTDDTGTRTDLPRQAHVQLVKGKGVVMLIQVQGDPANRSGWRRSEWKDGRMAGWQDGRMAGWQVCRRYCKRRR